MDIDVKNLLMKYSTFFSPTGSRIICNPPPMDTDEDWIVYVENPDELITLLDNSNFEYGGSLPTDRIELKDYSFISFKRNELNLIITNNQDFYINFVKATSEAKRLNLLFKQDRINLFQKILYGNITFK